MVRRISRSSHEALFTCPRKWYWGYEYKGTGLDTPLRDLKLVIGISVHAGLELLMNGASADEAADHAVRDFLEGTKAHKEAWGENPRSLATLDEARLLVEALVYGWGISQLASFLGRFRIIHAEQELETGLSPDVVLQSRLDVLVRERATGLN